MIYIFSICSTHMFRSCLTIIKVRCYRVSTTMTCTFVQSVAVYKYILHSPNIVWYVVDTMPCRVLNHHSAFFAACNYCSTWLECRIHLHHSGNRYEVLLSAWPVTPLPARLCCASVCMSAQATSA